MTATANFRQVAQNIGLAVCGLIVRTAFGMFGILLGIISEIVNGLFRVAIGIIVAILSTIAFFGLHPLVIHPLILTDMAKRNSKTAAQQCRYYEVDNIFEYMVETYINGNISVFRELYHELNKDTRKDFTDFLLSEVEPTYWREILKETI